MTTVFPTVYQSKTGERGPPPTFFAIFEFSPGNASVVQLPERLRTNGFQRGGNVMKIIDPGHSYLLDSLDGGEPVALVFVKREGAGFPFNAGAHCGTNVQEVLRALIERAEYLNRQVPCVETEAAAGCLRAALALFELRAARRHDRQLDLPSTQHLCCLPTCPECGHVGCEGHGS